MRGYLEKMAEMLPRKPEHREEDYQRYELAMDAICSRRPQLVKWNCIEMLRRKVKDIRNSELRDDAKRALEELEADCCYL